MEERRLSIGATFKNRIFTELWERNFQGRNFKLGKKNFHSPVELEVLFLQFKARMSLDALFWEFGWEKSGVLRRFGGV